jgi:hypothetical protein
MRVSVATLCAATIALAGCGESSENAAGDRNAADDNPRSVMTAAPSAAAPNCGRASAALINAIETGLEVDGGGSLRRGFIVRSKDFSKVFMVAAEIDGSGLRQKGDVGVWATNSRQGDGLIMAVDAVAQEFSDWGDADKTDAAIESSADGVAQAKECAEG